MKENNPLKKQSFVRRLAALLFASPTACLLAAALLAPGGAAADPAARYDHRNRDGRQLLLRAEAIEQVAARYRLTVLDRSGAAGDTLYLVEGPPQRSAASMVEQLKADSQVSLVEPAAVASLPVALAGAILLDEARPDLERAGTYSTRCQSRFLPNAELWSGFSDQRAARNIRVATAHQASWGCGAGVKVAVIDTGVDEFHPLLEGAVLPGFDLFDPAGTGSEWSSLDHSVRAIVEHSVRAIVEQSAPAVMTGGGQAVAAGAMAPVLGEDAIVAFEANGLPPYFGHGTMVAGLIRMVAPGAQIVPIRAFDSDGTGNVYDIVRAIRWATDQGVQVINMSFSMEASPTELRAAIRYAESHGVLMVAAAGNQGERQQIYPAAFTEVLGAAAQSTAASGGLAAFSNWGVAVADIAAPGSAVITTFPGGLYAAGWGTSFSSPLVAGVAALIYERPICGWPNRELRIDLLNSTVQRPALNGKVLSGQLDVYRAWVYAGN